MLCQAIVLHLIGRMIVLQIYAANVNINIGVFT